MDIRRSAVRSGVLILVSAMLLGNLVLAVAEWVLSCLADSIKLRPSVRSTTSRSVRDAMTSRLKARVRFLTPGEGGRQTPPASGYRPPVWFGELDDAGGEVLRDWSFEFEAPDGGILDQLELGREGVATMTAISQAPPEEATRPGSRFEVREGANTVAHGAVIGVVEEHDGLCAPQS